MTDKKIENVVFHPDALEDLDEQQKGEVLGLVAQFLVPDFAENMISQSQACQVLPPNETNCLYCRAELVEEEDGWPDEFVCVNEKCAAYQTTVFMSADSKIGQRMLELDP